MIHINIKSGRGAIIEASGDCETVAGEMAAVVGVIYSRLCDSGTGAGDLFRAAIVSMLSEDASLWEKARRVKVRGGGYSIVIDPPERAEG